ncbi:hypothetical protein TTRE_0000543301 [Trichuris trichiura]|uniref:Nitric oxide-associated protein 1 n=1 Tax=Trichuris trichiura TaxID=36087 RepID=A0A077ZA96_TRITR|nr:hypothetical protein TTRE_0000543301 [Trichuris trichiura]
MLASYFSGCLLRFGCKSCTLVLQFASFGSARDAFSNNRRLRQLLLERLQQYEVTESHHRLTKETAELPLCVERDLKSLPAKSNASTFSEESANLDSSMPSRTFKDFAFTEAKVVDHCSADWLDRGFHVRSDGKIVDEYTLGSTDDLPLENKESVETIFFQHPHQATTDFGVQAVKPDWKDFYGTEDASVPPSQSRCQGCGAQFHCADMSLPGFVPYEIFLDLQSDKLAGTLCRRCFLLKKHNFLVNVTVAPIDYTKIISHLKLLQEVLIILLVDLLDFPCSFFNSLPDFIGENKSVIVLVNKVCLFLPVCQYVYGFLKEHGFCDRLNIILTKVISAKTGWGVENLITFIHRKWANRGIAARISLLCSTRFSNRICAKESWKIAGTTLNLLKFPLLNPTPRKERLKHLALTKKQKFSLLNGYLGMSYKQTELEKEMEGNASPKDHSRTDNAAGRWNPEDPDFKRGKWFYDTPGVINDNQVLQLLTLEELILTMPRSMLKPREYLLKPGSSLLLAGLARIDKCEGNKPVLVKVYASDCLPIFVMPSVEVNEFYQRYILMICRKRFLVPCGSPQRLQQFPGLQCKQVSLLEGTLVQDAAKVDVVLSSIGWASFTRYPSKEDNTYVVWTPLGKGIYTRPSFLSSPNKPYLVIFSNTF